MPAESPFAAPARKTALVTGGAKRLGRELALALARTGMDVAITVRESLGEAAATAREIEGFGVRSIVVEMDVRDEMSVRHGIAETAREFGGLDVLVNNAAVFESAPLGEITLEQWDAVFAANTRGPFLTAREALPLLKARRGRIVNLGSLGGNHAWAMHGHYCASKA